MEDFLIIADLHLGISHSMQKNGIFLPIDEYTHYKEKIQNILKEEPNVKKLIINGDCVDPLYLNNRDLKLFSKFHSFLSSTFDTIVLIYGNHDATLQNFFTFLPNYKLGNLFITHGHKKEKKEFTLIAHEHPAVKIGDLRKERFKCYLINESKSILVMPSFCDFLEHRVVGESPFLSPIIKGEKMSAFIYNNGKLYKVPF